MTASTAPITLPVGIDIRRTSTTAAVTVYLAYWAAHLPALAVYAVSVCAIVHGRRHTAGLATAASLIVAAVLAVLVLA